MDIFAYLDYRVYVRQRIRLLPSSHGQFTKLAHALGMHTTSVSQVFRGHKMLTPEQGCALAAYFQLNDLETEYLLTLVQLERAGTPLLKNTLQKKRESIRAQS